jgi:hypothetical protein
VLFVVPMFLIPSAAPVYSDAGCLLVQLVNSVIRGMKFLMFLSPPGDPVRSCVGGLLQRGVGLLRASDAVSFQSCRLGLDLHRFQSMRWAAWGRYCSLIEQNARFGGIRLAAGQVLDLRKFPFVCSRDT